MFKNQLWRFIMLADTHKSITSVFDASCLNTVASKADLSLKVYRYLLSSCFLCCITHPHIWNSKLLTGGRKKKSLAQHKYYSEFLGSISLMSMELLSWIIARALLLALTLSLSLSPLCPPHYVHLRTSLNLSEILLPGADVWHAVAVYGNRSQLRFGWLLGDGAGAQTSPLFGLFKQTYTLRTALGIRNCQVEFFSKCSHTHTSFYSAEKLEMLGWVIASCLRLNTPNSYTVEALKGTSAVAAGLTQLCGLPNLWQM